MGSNPTPRTFLLINWGSNPAVPVFEIVVRALVNLRLDDVAPIFHQEDQIVCFVSDHVGNFLSCKLE